jgi:2-polyprenyl-3-methyl-5-hydroxy-6-metoxy-1,4-benzoquinol methylase
MNNGLIIDQGNFETNISFLEKVGNLTPEMGILEIGSGSGHMVKHLRDRGFNVIGTEINPEYIALAKEKFGIDLLPMSGDKLDFPDRSFDVVLSFDVFEHIPDSDLHLREVARTLRDDGRYMLETPNKLTNVVFEIIRTKSLTKWKEYHMSVHTYWQLRKRFSKNGYEYEFIAMPVVTDWYRNKVRRYLGRFGTFLLRVLNPDKWPWPIRTNFYLVARKGHWM